MSSGTAVLLKQVADYQRMAAVARGDLAPMSEIYENRHRALLGFFFRLTGKQQTAEDLVHEVFLRMIQYRHTFQEANTEAEFEAWMYRIARNTLVDHTRKHRRECPATADFDIDGGWPTPFETAARRQDLALLYRAMRELPGDKRELLVLTRFQNLSYQQIGRILGCETGAVKSRVFRALKELSSIYFSLCKEKA